jgi:hypothetical protein
LSEYEISELINGSDSELEIDGDEEKTADDNFESELLINDVVVPEHYTRNNLFGHDLDPEPKDDEVPQDLSFMRIGDLSSVNESLFDHVVHQLNEPILDYECTSKDKICWIKRSTPFQRCDVPFSCSFDGTSQFVETSPLHYFSKIFPQEFFESAAKFTNVYAAQQKNRFKNSTAEEIMQLFGLKIAMGTLKFPRIRLYWNRTLGNTLLYCF